MTPELWFDELLPDMPYVYQKISRNNDFLICTFYVAGDYEFEISFTKTYCSVKQMEESFLAYLTEVRKKRKVLSAETHILGVNPLIAKIGLLNLILAGKAPLPDNCDGYRCTDSEESLHSYMLYCQNVLDKLQHNHNDKI